MCPFWEYGTPSLLKATPRIFEALRCLSSGSSLSLRRGLQLLQGSRSSCSWGTEWEVTRAEACPALPPQHNPHSFVEQTLTWPGLLQEELPASTLFFMQTDRRLANLSQATTLNLNLRPKKIVHSDTRAGTNSHTSIDITNEPRKHREREGVYFLLFVYLLNLSQVWIANSNWLPRNKNNCYF